MIHMDKNFYTDSGQIAMLEKMLTCDEDIEKLASMEHAVTPMQAKVSKWLQLWGTVPRLLSLQRARLWHCFICRI